MERVAFVGSYDKTDMLLYIAKILTILKKKVIVIDSTVLQKSRYIIPTMQPLRKYITTFQGVNIAIGFEDFEDIKQYQESNGEKFEYDYALIDIDSTRGYKAFQIQPTDKHYFVTSFDLYCLKRGLQVFKILQTPVEVTKVLYSKDILEEENQYLNYLSSGLKVKWKNDIIYFPYELGDQTVIFTNQRSARIRIKGLSTQYIDCIEFITEDISEIKQGIIRKAIKLLERN